MIRSALEYLLGLAKPEIIEINGQQYSSKRLEHVKVPAPADIAITTLTGLVDYISTKIDTDMHTERVLVHVESPTKVSVYSQLLGDKTRHHYITCQAQLPRITFNSFMDAESFNIMLQSCFVKEDTDATTILKVVGNIKEEMVKQISDDGVSQAVTAKAGIARVEEVVVPNPVKLAPFRTFTEIKQPASNFVLRMQDGPKAALFEADGGAWKNEAMLSVKAYLAKELEYCKVEIIA